MAHIEISPINELYVKVVCENGIDFELVEHFSFKVPGYRFNPKYKAGMWDGTIRLFSRMSGRIYKGLVRRVQEFAADRGYDVVLHPGVLAEQHFSIDDLNALMEDINIPFEMRDYQQDYILHSIREGRALCISPTSSGKSFIVYVLVRFFMKHDLKILLLVDTINLKNQLWSDFEEYGFAVDDYVHRMDGSKQKYFTKPIVETTWSTAARQSPEWLNQFDVIMIDECHRAKAASVKKIFESNTKAQFRLGFTGTLDGTETNQMVLEGLMGPVVQFITIKELQERGYSAKLKIKVIMINYPEDECKAMKNATYAQEIAYIYGHERRNNLIKKLALGMKGNNIVMFHHIQHGKKLYEAISKDTDMPTYFVAGEVAGEDRERIRKIIQTHENSATCASSGTFSTGVNIPNINNMISGNPSKSQIKVLQTIGRGLRVTKDKDSVTYVDIVDNLSWKKKRNYTLRHFGERLAIYNKEGFEYSIHTIDWS